MLLSTSSKLRNYDRRWNIVQPPDDIRCQALARLYARRSAVDNLITALERYQQDQGRLSANCAAATAGEMLS
jgi:hypothetical protein